MNRDKEKDCEHFIDNFKMAISNVSEDYFEITQYNSPTKKLRERVFCYELYHQTRVQLKDYYDYKFHGEMDKKAHDSFKKEKKLKNSVPDFIVHVEGDMSYNLIVIEVKHYKARISSIESDLDKLSKFLKVGEYHKGIMLVFGGSENEGIYRRDVLNRLCDLKDDRIDIILVKNSSEFIRR